MALSKALPPAQKPDPTRSKSDDVPHEPGKGTPSLVHRAPQPRRPEPLPVIGGQSAGGDGRGRARRFNELQRAVGNARLSRMLDGTARRKPANEEPLADVYGVD